ncbi:hypothetical protein T11_8158 [Trichinella zimbabwensis]|uniref:Uncharacterized protein n=1 Tax=Trichinella zimbabwensis TaxID=268475 RepID=A0A0V1HDG4_9BILA|nr:hypothetical protein T11_8158 [Trichinella zimbabwensis]
MKATAVSISTLAQRALLYFQSMLENKKRLLRLLFVRQPIIYAFINNHSKETALCVQPTVYAKLYACFSQL